ncbi:aminoacetone oxidase family FAD-binding enzyme [Putridiphycobacter roseus]|uniref:Aminoacetone oxidase family FAD-binding enzyme n=1 Tax=Putridiphycobacter roseus TaxID=2219161 RepID=A0A2W1NPD3_9FLAO|nr:NAD(P)/FAD-dependent oxidoreductase [Putridiphycobacter roseus]PZE17492.1 aminoacetone oxidase family FAD-binding enzyme [Putridiphycobacter roseus]
MEKIQEIAIIGGGAAGFFAAIQAKSLHPTHQVTIYEKSKKTLSKVKISGGGRCNVTNATYSIAALVKNYPRGNKALKKVFAQFDVHDTIAWFKKNKVELTTQNDGCIFPVSQNSQTIIDCFLNLCRQLKIEVITEAPLTLLEKSDTGFDLTFRDFSASANKVIVAVGGQPKINGFDFLKSLNLKMVEPLPSLFTFNMPNESVRDLMGIVVENAKTRIQGTKLVEDGPLLITHWGMSGPAILKLSAWGARLLAADNYHFKVQVNWLGNINAEVANEQLTAEINKFSQKKIANQKVVNIPSRLWDFLLKKIAIDTSKKWAELGKKDKNKLIDVLVNDIYEVKGKTTFKEEFVTAGGIDLNEIDFNTMQAKKHPGIYFTGEGLDVDGITGGFNFQAAWSTAFVAGKLLD